MRTLSLSRFTIAQRLWLGLGLILGLFAVADLVSLWAASRVDIALRTLVGGADERREATYQMKNGLAAIIRAAREGLEGNQAQGERILDAAQSAFDQALTRYAALASTERSRGLAEQAAERYESLKRYAQQLSRLAQERKRITDELSARQRQVEAILRGMPVPVVPARQSVPVQRLALEREIKAHLRAAARDFGARLGSEREELSAQLERERAQVKEVLARYQALSETPAERAWGNRAARWSTAVTKQARMVFSAVASQQRALEELRTAGAALDDVLSENMQPAARAELIAAVESASWTAHEANLGITRALLAALVLGALVALGTTRAVRGPLSQLVASSRRLADGQFHHRVTFYTRDEVGELADAFNEMAEKLQSTTVSHAYLGSIVDSIGEALIVVSRAGTIQTANPAAAQLLGCEQANLPGRALASVLDDPAVAARISEAQFPLRLGASVIPREGSAIPVFVSAVPMPNGGATAPAVVCIAQDLRERISAEKRQRQTELVFENTREGIVLTDPRGLIVSVNPAFREITHYESAEASGKLLPTLWSHREDIGFVERVWAQVQAKGEWQGEIWMRRRDGELLPVWKNISAVRDASGEIANFVVVFSDISAIKQAEERLNHLAYYDALTNLPNRFLFGERLRLALARAEAAGAALALLYIDLDDFKHLNDTLGHDQGDRLLQEMSRRLPGCVPAPLAVARLGGDEFIVLLEDLAGPQQAARIAERILEAIGAPFELSGIELRMSASIGIGLSPVHGVTVDALLKAADAAMYRAKRDGGRSFQFFSAELTKEAMEQLTLRNALRHPSLQEQLVLDYQPQVSLESGRIVGVEALVRWRHPTRGLLPPGHFISVAEEAGLIHLVGEWVLRAACTQAKSWQDSGYPPLRVAVNVSVQEVRSRALVDRVERSLAETGLDPALLELEVTEGALQSGDAFVEVLEKLRRMGVRLALDDFGAGYSSLGSLRSLPFHRLKIDRSFVRDLQHEANDRSIARAIIAMGRSLNLEILAEGVETLAQLRILQREGCDEVQGYLLGQPMAAEALDTQFPDRLARLPLSGPQATPLKQHLSAVATKK